MTLSGKNIIGNTDSGESTSHFQAINPANGESLPTHFVDATPSEVDQAATLAENAFTAYRDTSNESRAGFLEAIADEILALGDVLLLRAMAETSLPLGRLTGERGRTMGQLKLFAKVVREGSWVDARIDTAQPDRQPFPKADIRHMNIPLGPVGIFGASNFPLAFSVAGGDTASALAAGCPIVVKAHPLHPGTSELVGRAIRSAAQKTNMPEGVFSLVQGRGIEVGMAIVNNPHIQAIGFTGSYRGGKAIFDAANARQHPIPVFAEMGSTNPVFLLPSALTADTAAGFCNSLNLGVGQFCTNPGIVITDGSEQSKQFVESLSGAIQQATPGNMLSQGIKKKYESGVQLIDSAEDVSLIATSQSSQDTNAVSGHLFSTSASTFMSKPILEEEVFGPSSLHVSAESKSELISIAESLDGHLTATIFGTAAELEEHAELVSVLQRKVGRLIFNAYPTGVEVCESMVHGGPFPATTASQSTSVGTGAIKRFARPLCYQGFPQSALPLAIQDGNPLGIVRMINGAIVKD